MLPQSKPPPQTPPGAHYCRCSIHFPTQESSLSWQPLCPYGQSETDSFSSEKRGAYDFPAVNRPPTCHCEGKRSAVAVVNDSPVDCQSRDRAARRQRSDRGNLLSVGSCVYRPHMSLRASDRCHWRGNPFPLSMFHLQNRCKRSTDCHGSSSLAMTEDFGCIKNGLPYCP